MPFLLLAGMGLSAFMTGVGALAYVGIVIMIPFSKSFTMNDVPVTRSAFLAESWPFFVTYPLLLAAFGLVAYGLWRERPWSRDIMMALWLLGAAASVILQFVTPAPRGDFLAGLFSMALCAGLAGWYLYGTATVRSYYQALSERYPRAND
jgi:hypothetical protein